MKSSSGFVLISVLVFLSFLTALVLSSIERGVLEQKMVRSFQQGLIEREKS